MDRQPSLDVGPAALLRGTTARRVGCAVRDEVKPVVGAGADPVVRAALPAVGSSGDETLCTRPLLKKAAAELTMCSRPGTAEVGSRCRRSGTAAQEFATAFERRFSTELGVGLTFFESGSCAGWMKRPCFSLTIVSVVL